MQITGFVFILDNALIIKLDLDEVLGSLKGLNSNMYFNVK